MLVRLARMGVLVVSLVALDVDRGLGAESEHACGSTKIHVTEELQPVVAGMLATSATFRQQWQAIESRELVHVAIFLGNFRLDATCRAKTDIRRYSSGLLVAVIHIGAGEDHVELLGHELEHVLEQIEGIDLDALARDGSGRAKRRIDGAYETVRARHAGLTVAAEVRMARPE